MEYMERFKTNLAQTLDIDLKHWIRLIVIIGGYLFIRQITQRELTKRQLKQRLADDDGVGHEQDKTDTSDLNELGSKGDSATTQTSFGWGKKTRQRVRKQEELLEKEVQRLQENAAVIDPEEDKDIEDLLID